MVPHTDAGKVRIWTMLFVVLGLGLVILTVGAVLLLALKDDETSAALLIAPVSAIIAGTVGLFATSPTR